MSKVTKSVKGGSLASDAVLSVMKGNKCDFQQNKVQLDMTSGAGSKENNLPFNLSTLPLDNKGFIQIASGRKDSKIKKTKNNKTFKGGMYANSIHELQTPYFIDSANNIRTNEGGSTIFGATVPVNNMEQIANIFNGEKRLLNTDDGLPQDLRFDSSAGFFEKDFKAPTLGESLVDVKNLLDDSVRKASVYPQSPVSELTLDNFKLPNNFFGGSRKNKKRTSSSKEKKTRSKNKNPYILFCQKQREILKKKGLSSKQIIKKCGELWRAQKK